MELTKQEKKAYDKLNDLLLLFRVKFRKDQKLTVSDLWWIEAILNLINKLVKENEELKEKNDNIERSYQDYRILSVGIAHLELLIREARVISEVEERDEKTKEYYKTRLKCLLDLYSELYNSETVLDYIPKDKIRELFKELYIIEESKYAKIKTIDSDKLYKFVKDIEKLLKEE